jgi:hypothetical protein
MPFPSPSAFTPSLSLYQMSYRGVEFGGIAKGTNQALIKLTKGREPPPVVSGDVQRALDQGEFAGLDLLPGKDVELEQVIMSSTEGGLDLQLQQLASVLSLGQVEVPLYLKLPSGTYACMAKPRKHAPVTAGVDVTTIVGRPHAGLWATLLHCTDPRWYAVPTKTMTVGLPTPAGGLEFPVTFNASFGGGGTGSLLELSNLGNFEMRPVLIIKGPCTNPVVTNLSLPGEPYVGFNITLAEGDVLEVKMDFESVLYTPSGSPGGSSRRSTLMPGSTWWNLPTVSEVEEHAAEGANKIRFTSSDGIAVAGTLTINYASAYSGI